ncbi:mitochondrial glyco protein [Saccharata proteae CBS 121410]|uniref:Mitochondrial glyco protein n=1 Tax=Saccharata proteae CBS 121410 TaxID=1314787 RepID=A0A9P4HT95_9PEZI|nr:mitochondrial glyco protein [Saccharata proteae CBS 121410]
MFALRTLARSAPRLSIASATRTARPLSSAVRASKFQPVLCQASAFHTTRIVRSDEELVAKLEKELREEKVDFFDQPHEFSTSVRDFLDNSDFKIDDQPGKEEVTLTKTANGETIKVVFTTADFTDNMEEGMEEDDDAMLDEDEDASSIMGNQGGANTKGSVARGRTSDGNIRVAPEDKVSPADRPELEDDAENDQYDEEDHAQAFPARAFITITKDGDKGALVIEAVAQDSQFSISNVNYIPTKDLVDPSSAEADWKRRNLYLGPPFGNLDEDLQILLEDYLNARGVNTQMALFIPDYVDFKEQREYVQWLENVKNFVAK